MRSLRLHRLPFFVTVALIGSANCALGMPLTFYFDGYIDFIHDFADLDQSVFVGAPFSGTYTFDPTGVSDDYPEDPRLGAYLIGSAGRLWANIGNYQFVTNDLGMLIANDLLSGDIYQVSNASTFEAAGMQWSDMSIVLGDATRTALNSDALFTGVPDLSAFATFRGLVLAFPGDTLAIRGVLTSLTPEPGSLVLLSLGVGVLLSRRSQSQKR